MSIITANNKFSGKYKFFGKLIKSFEFEYKNNGNPIVFCYNNTINSKGI